MINICEYIEQYATSFKKYSDTLPWQLTQHLPEVLQKMMLDLHSDFKIFNQVAIHKSVVIDSHATLKGPAIISQNCFIGAHCYITHAPLPGQSQAQALVNKLDQNVCVRIMNESYCESGVAFRRSVV